MQIAKNRSLVVLLNICLPVNMLHMAVTGAGESTFIRIMLKLSFIRDVVVYLVAGHVSCMN